MILAKNKEGELCLIGNQSIQWYHDYTIIKALPNLPIELKRLKVSDSLHDILLKQQELLQRAKEEVKLRHKVITIIEEMYSKYT